MAMGRTGRWTCLCRVFGRRISVYACRCLWRRLAGKEELRFPRVEAWWTKFAFVIGRVRSVGVGGKRDVDVISLIESSAPTVCRLRAILTREHVCRGSDEV
jgi:hypothetical protein